MKGRYIVVVVLASLLIISGIIGLVWNKAPFNTPSLTEGEVTPAPILTAQEVISRIQVYALPELEGHGKYGPKNPVGQWAAVYEGDGLWRVRGAVVVQTSEGKEHYYSTIWIYQDGRMELVDFSGEEGIINPFRK
jgi:hypothetical protein